MWKSVPSLPTDNLYKFLTMLGLALVVVGAAIYEDAQRSTEGILEQARTRRLDDALLEQLTLDFERSKEKGRIGEMTELAADLPSLSEQARRVIRRVDDDVRVLRATSDMIDRADFADVFLRVGGTVSILGFALWYWRHQRHQDALIRCQVRKAQAEAKETSRSPRA